MIKLKFVAVERFWNTTADTVSCREGFMKCYRGQGRMHYNMALPKEWALAEV